MRAGPRSPAADGDLLATRRIRFLPVALAWTIVLGLVVVILALGDPRSATSMVVGNGGIAVALLFAAVACFRTARLSTAARSGWTLMAVAMTMGLLGQLIFALAVVAGEEADPSAVSDSFSFLIYALPAVVALFLFPRPTERLISRFRGVLDAAVITLGVVVISEATLLPQMRAAADFHTITGISRMGFLLVDLCICAVVLTLGMLQPSSNRLVWLSLGAGMVILAVTDSLYGALRAQQVPNLTSTALAAGWMAAPILIGLATLLPKDRGRRGWDLALPVRLVPYVPLLVAILVLGARPGALTSVLLLESLLLLLIVAVRQVMIVYENLTLTRDLESRVAARTAELATFASIVTSSSDAIVGLSEANLITTWNPAAEQLYGYRAADVVGQRPDFLDDKLAAAVPAILNSARQGKRMTAYEIDWERPDQTVVPVAVTVSPVVDGSAFQGISIIGQDITERRQIARNLEHAREEALESSRLKSEFLATMSHEIRTPMNGVIGLTSLLIDTDLDAVQRRYAEGVQTAGQSLLDVINDILDFSKLEAGKVVLDEEDFDLRRLVEKVGNLLAPAAFAKGLELLISCPPDTPAVVRGDHVRTRQILLNLASNAVKFTSTGEVTVKVEAQSVAQDQVQLRFEVIDTGIGIAQKDRQRMFESFSQADASTTRRFGGTGLGLAICSRLVEAMGGTIGVQSELGVGSTFWFEVPLPVGRSAPLQSAHVTPGILAGLRILVVDDNAANRAILDVQLRSWELQTELMEDATSALAHLREAASTGVAYDLVVLDMVMPGADGLWLAGAVTADPVLAGTPMIMLTSAPRLPLATLREAGIGQWLTKPVSSSELHDRLMRLMAPRLPEEPARPPAAPTVPVRGRILIAEDNALNQLVAAGLVSRLGFEVDAVSNGAEAVDAVGATAYVAVLMDCHMPVMDGFAATREIRRSQGGTQRTPVIALTAGALVSDRERCLAAGMDDYISKPVDFDALELVLGRWVPDVERPPVLGEASRAQATLGWSDQPAVDSSRLEVLLGLQAPDGSSLIESFVTSFTVRSRNRLATIRSAATSGQSAELAAAAHELRGSAATIGAVQVAAICALLERAGRDRTTVAPQLLDELDEKLARARTALTSAAFSLTAP